MNDSIHKHKWELRGLSKLGNCYRFRCKKCGMRAIVYKNILRMNIMGYRRLPLYPKFIDRKEN